MYCKKRTDCHTMESIFFVVVAIACVQLPPPLKRNRGEKGKSPLSPSFFEGRRWLCPGNGPGYIS